MSFKNISIIGLGYIGLPTATMFAKSGLNVGGVDVDINIVDKINKGEIHITEPLLDNVVKEVVKSKRLSASTKLKESDAFIIAVPTPFKKDKEDNLEPDLSYLKDAVKSISKVLKKGDLIILESTSPVGTTEKIVNWLKKNRNDLEYPSDETPGDINICYCPERVLPGKILDEIISNDRIIGGITEECAKKGKELYSLFVKGDCILTDSRTAEMAKLTENASRDVQIAFANELSFICEKNDIDVWNLIKIVNRHPRVNILQPGPGVGGHCIAVDPWFIVSANPNESKMIKVARNINDSKPKWVIEKINKLIKKNGDKKAKLAFFGLAFKANIDDLRESPALDIVNYFDKSHGSQILVVEPNITELPELLTNSTLSSPVCAYNESDILVILVDHDEFKEFDYKRANVFDTRGISSSK